MSLFSREDGVPLPALLKRFGLIHLATVLLFSAVLLTAIRLDDQARLENIKAREQGRLDIAQALITHALQTVDSDVRIAASLPVLHTYLDHGALAQREALANLFLVWVRESARYDQLRYIDNDGQEIIRINYNEGRPGIVPQTLLQNKAERYFVRDTLKLDAGQIYVSPLDLNFEQERVEIPYKPVIRFGTPVFDSAGRKKGILIFNYLADQMLKNFREAMAGDERQAMLINRDGYWLSNPDHSKEWGFMLGAPELTFPREFAEEWRSISGIKQSMVETPRGLFFHSTVWPLTAGQTSSTGSALSQAPSAHVLNAGEYHWKLISYIPAELIAHGAGYKQPGTRGVLLVVYLLLAAGAWIVARTTLSRAHANTALTHSEARYDQLVRNLPVGVYLFRFRGDGTMGFEYVSAVFCQILALDAREVLRDATLAFACAHPDDHASLLQTNRDAADTLKPFRWEGRFMVRGETRWIRISSDVIPQQGAGSLWSGLVSDITDRKRATLELQRSAQEIEDLYDHAPCGYHSLDANGLIVRINSTALEWLGYQRDEVLGRMHIVDLFTPNSRKIFQASFPTFKETGSVRNLEYELRRKDGTVLPVLLSATAVRDEDGRFVMSRSTIFDLTERKKLEKELERQAHIDVLTGLNNRRHFLELAEHELSRARRHGNPLSMLMLDVDHFKQCNDSHGHHVGDQVLQKLGTICSATLREADLPGRIGGEEFAVLLPETDAAQALEVAERLRLAFAAALTPLEHGGSVRFTVSIGVAHLTAADDDLGDLLKRADAALYAAKNLGRNRVCDAAATATTPLTR